MNKSVCSLFSALLFFACGLAVAQSYDFRQGYIFEQKYVKRISLVQAEGIAGVPGLFTPFLSWEWGAERIVDSRVKRSGNSLIFEFAGNEFLSLRDFSRESTEQLEGDSQHFQYLESVQGYHIVGVVFGHDQPAFLLVSESGRELYFVDTQ